MPSSRESSQPRDRSCVSWTAGRLFTTESPGKPIWLAQFHSVQSLSCVRLFATPWITAHQASLSSTNSWSLLKLMSIESAMPSSHLILCCPLLLLPQSLPASRSFPMSQLFASGGQSTGVSASASVLPMYTQDWSPLGWTGWISLQSKGVSRVFSTPQFKSISFSALSFLHIWLVDITKPAYIILISLKI